MRVAFLTTVAAAALSLSLAAVAQTGGGAGGASGGAAGTSGGARSGGAAGTQGGAASSSSSSSTTNVNISGAQRTQAVQALSSVNIQPVPGNITVTVGSTLPTTVTQLVSCPQTLVSIVTGINDCRVVLVGDRYYIVEGSTRRVVTVIER
jgi:hypothetical protein